MEVKHRLDVRSGFVNSLMHRRLMNWFIKINHKEIFCLHKRRALAWHEKHLFASVDAGAQMGKSVAQSLLADDSQGGYIVFFKGS
jgi:hypothetical protein